ncbi:MAG: transposase [Pseudomonadota bacterium]
MAEKRYTPEQIIAKLRKAQARLAAGEKIKAVCRSLGISERTYYLWRCEFGGFKVDQVRQLKALEKENLRLRRAFAGSPNPTLDAMILKI